MGDEIKYQKLHEISDTQLFQIQAVFSLAVTSISDELYSASQKAAWISIVYDRKKWASKLAQQDVFVAFAGGRIIGFATLTAVGELDMLYVHPSWHRRDVASNLYNLIENEAINTGCKTIRTFSSKAAFSFFEKMGFESVEAHNAEIDGIVLENFEMYKRLVQ